MQPTTSGDADGDIAVAALEDGLVRITIDRAHKHNALARPVLRALAAAVGAAGANPQTHCILIGGAGDKYFAAGGDLVDLAAVRGPGETGAMVDEATAALDAVRRCPVPVVAYLNGDALGGGAELAVACDMRLFAPHSRLGFIHGRIGITSAWGGGTDLCTLVGPAHAMRMMSRCEMVDAQRALRWGLADAIVVDGPTGNDAQDFLEPLLGLSRTVLEGIKAQTAALRQGDSHAARRAIERRHLIATWASVEHWTAVDRFLKREDD